MALSPSERQATINLVSAIREGHLELRAGKVTGFAPMGIRSTYNKVVPEAALAASIRNEFRPETLTRAMEKVEGASPGHLLHVRGDYRLPGSGAQVATGVRG